MEMSDLPKGWSVATIAEIALKGDQRTPDLSEEFTYVDIGSIDRDLKIIATPQRLLGKDAPSRARKVINSGDVLVSLTRPNLNAVALVTEKFDKQIASTGFEVIKPHMVDSRYIFGLTRSKHFIDAISGAVQGALYPAAKSSDVQGYVFSLPPLAEQKVIADKLDTLLAQVDNTKARLERIPEILKSFRQSVLNAAVSGKLTEEWGGKNKVTHPKDTWKSAKEIDFAFEIPSQWIGVSLGSVSDRVSVGHVGKTSAFYTTEADGIPFLRSQNVRPGKVALEGLAYITPEFHRSLKKSQLKPGDLLVVRVGANRGDSCVLPEIFDELNCANIVFARPKKGLSEYLNIYFQSPISQSLLLGESVGGAQGVINTKSVESTFLALPPIEEQTEIVRRVEELFAFADRIEQAAQAALSRVNNLTQSILAKAFRGDLTSDWRSANPDLISGDKSAEALLAKIKAERATLAENKRGRKAAIND